MKRVLRQAIGGILCLAAAIGGFYAAAASYSSRGTDTVPPEQLINVAKDKVSLRLTGPVEIQAEVNIFLPKGGREKGTYTLEWAAPDRFRREIHLPNYDEVSVANGNVLYRKRNTTDTPLTVFRIEELMDPSGLIDQFERDTTHFFQDVGKPSKISDNPQIQAAARDGNTCVWIPTAFFGELCVDHNGRPMTVSRRGTADDETVSYSDYKRIGSGFVASRRKYFDGERLFGEADVKYLTAVASFPVGALDPPPGAETLAWCSDETPPQRLPFNTELPVDPRDFRNPEILDAFVNVDGTARRLEIMGTGGPIADAAIRKIASLIRFAPAMCGRKAIDSEMAIVIGEMDIWAAATGIPNASEKGNTNPACLQCPDPQYSTEAFHAKIQGTVLLSAVITQDGRAHDVHVLKGLGHGLDQQAVEAALDWRFKPANGPDGKPAAVHMLIEIDFHLY